MKPAIRFAPRLFVAAFRHQTIAGSGTPEAVAPKFARQEFPPNRF